MNSINRKTHITGRFCLALISVIILFGSCKNNEQKVYMPYAPSEQLALAIEQNNNPLQFCKTKKDSFYFSLQEANNLIVSKDSSTARAMIFKMAEKLPSLKYKPFEAQYHYLVGMATSADSLVFLNLTKSVNIYKSLEGPVNKNSLLSYYELAQRSKRSEAIPLLEKVLKEYPHTHQIEYQRAKLKLADLYNKQLKFEDSFKMREELLEDVGKVKDQHPKDYVDVLNAMAVSYYDLQELNDAVEVSESAIDFADMHKLDKFNLLYNLITFLSNASLFEKAEQRLKEMELIADTDEKKSDCEKLYGIMYFLQADDVKCINHIRRAIALSEGYNVNDEVWVDMRLFLTKSLLYLDRQEEAGEIINSVKQKFDFNDENLIFNQLNLLDYKIVSLYHAKNLSIGNSERLKRSLEDINVFLNKLDAYVSKLDEKNAISIYELCYSVFDLKFEVILRLHKLNPNDGYEIMAFQENEKRKAKSIFLKKLVKSNSEGEKLQHLIKTELSLRSEAIDNPDHVLYEKRMAVIDSISSFNDLYYDLHFAQDNAYYNRVLDYCRTRNVNILEFYSGLGTYFGALVNESGIYIVDIDYNVLSHYSDMVGLDVLNKPEEFDSINAMIYEEIFKPFESKIKGNKLLIVSDGIVDCVSFDSFKSEETNDYLVNAYEIDYCYSLKNILLNKNDNVMDFVSENKILAYSYTDEETIFSNSQSTLGELTGAYNECIGIQSIFGKKNVSIITGESSTIKHFQKHAPDKDIVHLALHGKGEKNSTRDNKLYFRGSHDKNYIESSSLSSFENNIDLLFLNVCETNKAKRIINEGNMSIARGFAESGVDNIITSSWEIHDMSSSELVTGFYTNLKSGLLPNESLREAKRKFILDNKGTPQAHPVYWGGLSFYFN